MNVLEMELKSNNEKVVKVDCDVFCRVLFCIGSNLIQFSPK